MNKKIIRYALAVIVALYSLLPVCFFLEHMPIYIVWGIIWACCFAFLANNQALLARGFLFLTSSLALGLLGIAYAKSINSDYLWAVEYLSQIMILVGAGVGGNLMAGAFQKGNDTA